MSSKYKTSFFIKACLIAGCVLFAFSLFTCTPGLGNQVDTRSPTVTIVSPATKSTLNGSFTVSGTASDDLAVSKITVTFTNIKTQESYGPFNATLNSNGTWTLNITPRANTTSNLPDGDYNIKAIAYDNSNHTGEVDVVYTIDTTAPTVMVTAPTTYGITPEFSKKVTIKGEVYDASILSSVYVYITDSNGVIKATSLAEGTNTFTAIFDSPSALSDYDGTPSTIYYYYVVATDIGGNSNTYYFHRSDIASLLASGPFPSINSIGYVDQKLSDDLLNGINSDSLETKRLKNINERNYSALLGETRYPDFKYSSTEQNKIQWLNVTGLSDLENGTSDIAEIAIGVSVFGTVLPTSDNSTQQNFEVYLHKFSSEESSNLLGTQNSLNLNYLSQINIRTDENLIRSTTNSTSASSNQAYFQMSGSSFSLEVKPYDPDVPNEKWVSGLYWIKVFYETDTGARLEDEALFYVSSEIPLVSETKFASDPSLSYYRGYMTAATKTAGNNKFEGTATTSDGANAVDSLIITYSKGGTSHTIDNAYNRANKTYSYTIDYATDGSDDGETTYTIKAIANGKYATVSRVVVIDTISPTISFTNLSEDSDSPSILNSSTFEIKGTAQDDSGISVIKFKLWSNDQSEPDSWSECGTSGSFAINGQMDGASLLNSLQECKTYNVKVQAIDSAGNETVSSTTFSIDLALPCAEFTSPDLEANSNYYLSTSKTVNFAGIASDNAITAGKNVKTAKLYFVNENDEETVIDANLTRTLENGVWKWSKSYTFTEDGNYTVYLEVEDDAGKTKFTNRKIKIDTLPPEISLSSVTPVVETVNNTEVHYKVNGTINLAFIIEDETKLGTVTYSLNGGTPVNYTSGAKISIDTADYPNGTTLKQIISITASDYVGNSVTYPSEDDVELSNYTIDQTTDKPTITSSSLENLASASEARVDSSGLEHNVFSKTTYIPIDLTDDDYIKTFKVKLDDAEEWTTYQSYTTSQKSSTIRYSLANLSYGTHTLYFRCEDEYWTSDTDTPNSFTEVGPFYIVVDAKVPILNVTTSVGQYVRYQFNIEGSAIDENGIEKIDFISKNESDEDTIFYTVRPAESDNTTLKDSPWNWNVAYDLSTDNKKPEDIVIRATDKVGRTTDFTFTYIYDSINPNRPKFVESAAVAENGYVPSDFGTENIPFAGVFIEGYVANTKNTITILGTVSDPGNTTTASGIKDVQWGLIEGKFDHESRIVVRIPQNDGSFICYEYADTLSNGQQLLAAIKAFGSTGTLNLPAGKTAHTYDPSGKVYYAVPETNGILNFCYYYDDETLATIHSIIDTGVDSSGQHARKFGWTSAALNSTSSAWMVSTAMPEFASGSYTIMFVSHDKVGNESAPLVHYLVADNQVPGMTVDAYENDTSNSNVNYFVKSSNDGVVTINGTVTDTNPYTYQAFTALEYIRAIGDPSWQPYMPLDIGGSGTEIGGFTAIDKKSTSETFGTSIGTISIDTSKRVWNNEPWTWTIQLPTDGEGNYVDSTYIVEYAVKDKAYYDVTPTLNCTTFKRTIVVDNMPPDFDLENIGPVINYNGDDCLNGDASVKVSIKETNLESAYYTFACTRGYSEADWATEDAPNGDFYDASGNSKWIAFTQSQLSSNWRDSIDTTDSSKYFTENGVQYLSLAFKAVDKAGNVAYYQLNKRIDQNADKPTMVATNLESLVLTSEEGTGFFNGRSVNVKSKNDNILFNLTDDDGIKYIYENINDTFAQDATENWTRTLINGSPTSITGWIYSLSDFEYGKHKVQFYAVDVNGRASDVITYYISIDDGAPALNVNPLGEYVSRNPIITGSANDRNGIDRITITFTNQIGDEETVTISYSSSTLPTMINSWTSADSEDSISLSNSGTMCIRVYDGLGNTREVDCDYKVDDVAPELTIVTVGGNEWTEDMLTYIDNTNSTLRVVSSITDADSDNISGSDVLCYEISSSSSHAAWTDGTGTEVSGTNGSYTFTADFTGLSGSNYIHMAGKDVAGNWSTVKTIPVAIDSSIPTTTISLNSGSVITGSSAQTITGTATDDLALVSITAMWRDSSEVIGTVDLTGQSCGWEISIPADATEGNREVTFTVKDKCNRTNSYSRTYKIDRTAPVLTFTNINATDGTTKFTSTSSDSIKVNINYSDSVSGVNTLDYSFLRSTDGGRTYSAFVGENSTGTKELVGSVSGSVDILMGDFLLGQVSDSVTTDGLWKISVVASDVAGSTQTYTSPAFWVDQNKPTLMATDLSKVQKIGNAFGISGIISDKNYGAVKSVVISISHPSYTASERAQFSRTFTVEEGLEWDSDNSYYTFNWQIAEGEDTSPFLYEGTYTIEVLGYDEAGNEREVIKTSSCDNDPPRMKFKRPYSMTIDSKGLHSVTAGNSKDFMGNIVVEGSIPYDGESGGMGEIYYQVGKVGSVQVLDAEGNELEYNTTTGFTGDEKIATVVFTEGPALTDSKEHDSIVRGWWKDTGNTTNYNWLFEFNSLNIVNNGYADNRLDSNGNATENLWTTYVYVVAKDLAGNINLAICPINIDTDTDKPTVTILSPSPNSDEDNRTFGGPFTIMGSSSDDNKIDKVFMQIEVVNGHYVNDVLTKLDGTPFAGDNISSTKTNYFVNRSEWYEVDLSGSGASRNWSLKINNDNVFDNEELKDYYEDGCYEEGAQSELIIRVQALDTKEDEGIEPIPEAVRGEIAELSVRINAGSPNIDITEFPMEDEYISGSFDYRMSITDDGTITSWSIKATGNGKSEIIDSGTGSDASSIEGSIDSVVLASTLGNKVTFEIKATDNSSPTPNTSIITRSLKIDNTAPNFLKTKVAIPSGDSAYENYIFTDAIDDKNRRDGNGNLRVASTQAFLHGYVKEESNGSDIDYVLLWFTQTKNDVTKIFSPGSYTSVDSTGSVISNTLTCVDKNGDIVEIPFPVASLSDVNPNDHQISYSGNSYSNGIRTPYIVINTNEAGEDSGASGDCDGYDENIIATGVWYVQFDSTKLADGIYDVNYLAKDKAGNVRYYKDSMFIMNNPPIITSFDFTTDLKGTKSLSDETPVNYLVNGSELSNSTYFKSLNYLTSIKVNLPSANNGNITYYISDGTTSLNSAEIIEAGGTKSGVTWNAATSTFILSKPDSQAQCPLLSATGTKTYTITAVDGLGLSSEEVTFIMDMQNTDTDAPIGQLFEFNTSSYSALTDDNWNAVTNVSTRSYGTLDSGNGHIEPRNTYPKDNPKPNPALSGYVWIRGEVFDNQRISKIQLYIDGDAESNAVTLASETDGILVAASGVELHQIQDQRGHYAEFAYLWDTSTVSGKAKDDVSIKLLVTDSADNKSTPTPYNSTENAPRTIANRFVKDSPWGYAQTNVTVAPYITSVSRNSQYKTMIARSGAVSLLRGEDSNTISGFNLANSEGKVSVSIGSVAMSNVIVSGNDITFKVSDSAKSGKLSVVVNGVEALNNNNVYEDYNTKSNNAFDHSIVTDDLFIHVWRVSSYDTFKGSKYCSYPAMAKGGDGTLYASYTNYGQSKTYYTKSFAGSGSSEASDYIGVNYYNSYYADDSIQSNGIATVFWGYDPPEETAIAVSRSGEVNVFYAANYHGGASEHWGGNSASNAGGIYVYDTHATDTQIQSNGYNTKRAKIYRSELYTYDDQLNQFKNIRITRTDNYIYLAYYDTLRGSIKTSVINDASGSRPDTSTNGLPWVTLDGGTDSVDDGGTSFSFAGGWKPFLNTNYGNGVNSRASGTGESVAITTNLNGLPVVLYMDSAGCLRIARASSVSPTTASNWNVQGVFASTDVNYSTAAGYMSCAIDSSGYLHIAFQNKKGQLVYAKSTNNPSNGTTAYTFGASQVIDETAMWIDMTIDGTTPYISYLSSINSSDGMKIAFLDSTFDEDNDGNADGGWETMTAPMADVRVSNVRTCIETGAKAYDGNTYTAAVGFHSGQDYRALFYVGE